MSCQDDLTAVDLSSNVAVQVLERVSAGSGRDENVWNWIDLDKSVVGMHHHVLGNALCCRKLNE